MSDTKIVRFEDLSVLSKVYVAAAGKMAAFMLMKNPDVDKVRDGMAVLRSVINRLEQPEWEDCCNFLNSILKDASVLVNNLVDEDMAAEEIERPDGEEDKV